MFQWQCPKDDFTNDEIEIVEKYGESLAMLEAGEVPASTEARRHFLHVMVNGYDAKTKYEMAWLKYRRLCRQAALQIEYAQKKGTARDKEIRTEENEERIRAEKRRSVSLYLPSGGTGILTTKEIEILRANGKRWKELVDGTAANVSETETIFLQAVKSNDTRHTHAAIWIKHIQAIEAENDRVIQRYDPPHLLKNIGDDRTAWKRMRGQYWSNNH